MTEDSLAPTPSRLAGFSNSKENYSATKCDLNDPFHRSLPYHGKGVCVTQ